MRSQEPFFIHSVFYRVMSYTDDERPGRGAKLKRLPMNPFLKHPWPHLANFEVRVEVFLTQWGIAIGAVRIVTLPIDFEYGVPAKAPLVAPIKLHADILRAIPFGQLQSEAYELACDKEQSDYMADTEPDTWASLLEAMKEVKRPRRAGRPSQLTLEATVAAAKAYTTAPNRPVIAAREALQGAGYPGSGPDGEVTLDQARKVVSQIRRNHPGLIPPVAKKH